MKGLEKIGAKAFNRTGIESVIFPTSLKVVEQGAFSECHSLREVEFASGLEVLGTSLDYSEKCVCQGVFEESALQSVKLPRTLKVIESRAFKNCDNLMRIELPRRLECVKDQCFQGSELINIKFPARV